MREVAPGPPPAARGGGDVGVVMVREVWVGPLVPFLGWGEGVGRRAGGEV